MNETAVHEAKTATSCTCTEIQAMSSTTETIIHQTAHHSPVPGDPRDPREAGDQIDGADAEIWTETDRGIETGNKIRKEGDARGTGAEKEKIGTGIADEVGKENTVGLQKDAKTENRGIEEKATAVTREAKEKRRISICLKGTDCYEQNKKIEH